MFSVAFMAKRTFWVICLCLTLILFPLPSYALTVQDVPNPRKEHGGWVTDMAQILSPYAEAKLNQIIFQLERQNGDELAVVTVPETTPAPNPQAFTTELFNYWGIGKQGKNNGVLFLVSKSDRHVEIRTGYGIESLLPNAQVSDIIQKEIIPQFKQGNFEDGILAGTQSLVTGLGANLAVHTNTMETRLHSNLAVHTNTIAKFNPYADYVGLPFILFFVLALLALLLLALGSTSSNTSHSSWDSGSSDSCSRSSWDGWDGGGGSDFGSGSDFGGGDSGGGGGGGDW